MDLKDYIDFLGISDKEFAYILNISPSALSNYIHKRREPRRDIRTKIIKMSKGKVTVEDLLIK